MIQFACPSASNSGSGSAGFGAGVSSEPRRTEVLGEEIARLSAHIQAATGRLLELIRAFDKSEGWYREGFTSCGAWLSWRTGVGAGAAREKVRVARALGELPELSAALSSGELSYSVARALTRIATADNEAELVEAARHTTAADLERLVAAWQAADRSEEDERARHARRYLRLTPEADGSWTVRGRLDPEVGAVLARALDAAGETLYGSAPAPAAVADGDIGSSEVVADPTDIPATTFDTPPHTLADTSTAYPIGARRADAIGLVAEAALGNGLDAGLENASVVGRAERFQVVLHVSAETSPPQEDPPRIEHGPHVSAETARRLACDAGLVTMTHDRSGNTLDVGRRRRTTPPALRRALDVRDCQCRFPGCTNRHCDAHHIKHWADGGETKLDNLLLLCRHHHRRVHEDGWRVTMSASGEVRFERPEGRLLPHVPDRTALTGESVRDLERRHDRDGIEIGAWTATPDSTGERLDVDWALFTLRRPALPLRL